MYDDSVFSQMINFFAINIVKMDGLNILKCDEFFSCVEKSTHPHKSLHFEISV